MVLMSACLRAKIGHLILRRKHELSLIRKKNDTAKIDVWRNIDFCNTAFVQEGTVVTEHYGRAALKINLFIHTDERRIGVRRKTSTNKDTASAPMQPTRDPSASGSSSNTFSHPDIEVVARKLEIVLKAWRVRSVRIQREVLVDQDNRKHFVFGVIPQE